MAWTRRGGPLGRTLAACALSGIASSAACNALLGNSDHDVATDARADTSSDVSHTDGARPPRESGPETGPVESSNEGSPPDTGMDAGIHPQQSCKAVGPGRSNCGPASESCCSSLPVAGGTFDRSYDGVTFANPTHTATVSAFQLDKYEITVGRFRKFVDAVVAGWRPEDGEGKHSHLSGGKGLHATGGGFETGWDAKSWNPLLATTAADWTTALSCDPTYGTWTPSAGMTENRPINCETWYEAYAFCIWDGGFLPSGAEWNFAAAGGGGDGGQRVYPWSSPSTNTTIDCTYANFIGSDAGTFCNAAGPEDVGALSPMGDGLFGQTDLAGNILEWALDLYQSTYTNPCTDCASFTGSFRVFRGGDWDDVAASLLASQRRSYSPATRENYVGARCARAP